MHISFVLTVRTTFVCYTTTIRSRRPLLCFAAKHDMCFKYKSEIQSLTEALTRRLWHLHFGVLCPALYSFLVRRWLAADVCNKLIYESKNKNTPKLSVLKNRRNSRKKSLPPNTHIHICTCSQHQVEKYFVNFLKKTNKGGIAYYILVQCWLLFHYYVIRWPCMKKSLHYGWGHRLSLKELKL